MIEILTPAQVDRARRTGALVAHILKASGRDTQLGGNIGTAVLTLDPPKAGRFYVVECSSYQIDLSPTIDPTAGILASGLTPLIAAWLVTRGDGTLWWVAGYNVLVAGISLVCARFLPETAGADLDRVDVPADDRPREVVTV